MATVIQRQELQRLVAEEDAQVVEVLPNDEYAEVHIAGAINMPLQELSATSASRLDRTRPVIVYCNDFT